MVEDESVNAALFDRQRRRVVLATDTGIEWWNYRDRQRLMAVPVKYTLGLVADASRETLVSYSLVENDARAWDMKTGRELRRMPYARSLHAIAVDPAGGWMATSGNDWHAGTDVLEIAILRPPELIDRACNYVSGPMTEEECDRHVGRQTWRETCPPRE